jgi:hypothetical protein
MDMSKFNNFDYYQLFCEAVEHTDSSHPELPYFGLAVVNSNISNF